MSDSTTDPYQLTPEEMQKLVEEITVLVQDEYSLDAFLRHRRTYLEKQLGPLYFRVRNRLMLDIYKKNYIIFARDIPATFDVNEGIKPWYDKLSSNLIMGYHSDGLPFSSQVYFQSASNNCPPSTCYQDKQLTCGFWTGQHGHYAGESDGSEDAPLYADWQPQIITSVVHTFTLEGSQDVPSENKPFVSIFKEQYTSFTIDDPDLSPDVLGQSAYLTGFLEYFNDTADTGWFNLYLAYREE